MNAQEFIKQYGWEMNKNRKPIFGVGINDHPQSVWVNGKVIKEYQVWTDVLRRCYSEFEMNRHPTYRECEASDGFKVFSVFLSWYRNQIGFGMDGWCLDKDILVKGNKLYSEDMCVIVPSEINNLFLKNNASRGGMPIGVRMKSGVYLSRCKINGRLAHLGTYKTSEQAFQAYKEAKEDNIKNVANKWRGQIDERAYEALMNYEVEITD